MSDSSSLSSTTAPSSVAAAASSDSVKSDQGRKLPRKRANNNRHQRTAKKGNETVAVTADDEWQPHQTKKNEPRRPQQPQKRKAERNAGGKFPWRAHIPKGSVDPITLESLFRLKYPPFALVAEAPYEPVQEWPSVVQRELAHDTPEEEEEKERRQRRILLEQWGKAAVAGIDETKEVPAAAAAAEVQHHYHLYDGRALAYYIVSQLQFIDPLNRRDLTRPELVNLDAYLVKHGFAPSVVAAYDAKGVTLSSAGSQAATAAGRAEILRQTAQGLLESLFSSTTPRPCATSSNSSRRRSRRRRRRNNGSSENAMAGLYQAQQPEQTRVSGGITDDNAANAAGVQGEEGWMVLDDDENPGLRSTNAAPREVAAPQQEQYPALLSSRPSPQPIVKAVAHIEAFPSLSLAARAAPPRRKNKTWADVSSRPSSSSLSAVPPAASAPGKRSWADAVVGSSRRPPPSADDERRSLYDLLFAQ